MNVAAPMANAKTTNKDPIIVGENRNLMTFIKQDR
jgi:hypothetical protein